MDKPVLGRLSSFGRGQAESRGRLRPFFCPKSGFVPADRLRSGLFNSGYWIWSKNTRPGARWVRTPGRDFVSAVWVELLRLGNAATQFVEASARITTSCSGSADFYPVLTHFLLCSGKLTYDHPYDLLGVDKGADLGEIKRAYRQLAKNFIRTSMPETKPPRNGSSMLPPHTTCWPISANGRSSIMPAGSDEGDLQPWQKGGAWFDFEIDESTGQRKIDLSATWQAPVWVG